MMKRHFRIPASPFHPVLSSIFCLVFVAISAPLPVWGETVEYDLTVAQQEVDFTGKPASAMTINGDIPGPTLRFKEGDWARIRVHNRMEVDTSIHWHGVLVPPGMDGVPYVSFPPIGPGSAFTYEFPIRQSGTYWYHSHTGLQEQKGVYGSIVIEPQRESGPKADGDFVVMLSDWTDEGTHEVLRTLKRGSEWYVLQKGSGQSIIGAARLGMLGEFFNMELRRMPPMDISDIAYDRFLANGEPETHIPAEPGQTLRLRIIDGGAGTNFHLEFAGGPMTIISADGLDVEPVQEQRFLIAIAETYDVLVRVPGPGAFEFRATAHDGSGHASVWIGSGKRHSAPEIPRPNLYAGMVHMGSPTLRQVFALTPPGAMGFPDRDVATGRFDRPGMMGMGDMHDMGGTEHGPGMQGMEHDSMEHPPAKGEGEAGTPTHRSPRHGEGMVHGGGGMADTGPERNGREYGGNFRILAADVSESKNLAVDGVDTARPWPPYARLRSTRETAFRNGKPVREIRLTLDGDMERYVWSLNKKTLSESDSILVREGEVARFIMINRTMMHHPMHLHGHFFRVINGQGDFAPLKHTVNVAPMSTTVIEFDANEFGDWFFHCHLLYHMKSGMARVVHYDGFTLNPHLAAVRPELYRDSWYFWGRAALLTNMTGGLITASNSRNILTAEWEVGWGLVHDAEWEALFTYDRYFNRFLTLFAGADVGDAIEEDRGIIGIRYLLPLNFESAVFAGTDGGFRAVLGKDFDLTPRIAISGNVQYDTEEEWEGETGLSYTVSKAISFLFQWNSDYGAGGGVELRF